VLGVKFAEVGGITLCYAVEGLETGIPLVFINSLGTDLRLWDELIPHFAEHFVIVRYDKRGHGRSDCPPGPYSIHDHADDLAALLIHLNLPQVLLIGISVGGMIALDYALRNPQHVRALVLCDTGAKIGTIDLWNARIEAVRKNGLVAVADSVVARWFTPDFAVLHPEAFREYHDMLVRTPAVGYAATCEALRDADLRVSVASIETQALVLCGAEDAATSPQLARELAESLPNARLEIIEQAAHLPCIEQPDVMAAKIKDFLREKGYVG
jgi:3-oxoadipate enol-lactonase